MRRVASKTVENVEQIKAKNQAKTEDVRQAVDRLRALTEEAAGPIRAAIMERVRMRLSSVAFPEMIFGIRDDRPKAISITSVTYRADADPLRIRGMRFLDEDVDLTPRAVAQKLPAIVIHDESKYRFWPQAKVTILTPDGIFTCPYVMCEPSPLTNDGVCRAYPDWTRRDAHPARWLRWAEEALGTIEWTADFLEYQSSQIRLASAR